MERQTEQIWAELGDRLRAFVARRVANQADAEDVVQEVFLRIHLRHDTLADERKLAAWAFQIARNAIVDHYRRRRPTTDLIDSLPVPENEPVDVRQELLPGLKPMMERLPAADRQALLLTEVDGLSQQELADRLGLSLSGAKSRVQRARLKLRQEFVACCQVEFDRRGGVAAYSPGCDACRHDQPDIDAAPHPITLGHFAGTGNSRVVNHGTARPPTIPNDARSPNGPGR